MKMIIQTSASNILHLLSIDSFYGKKLASDLGTMTVRHVTEEKFC
jgi:hypothetical protein